MNELYAPIYKVPASAPGGPVIYDYERHRTAASRLYYVKVKLTEEVALSLAALAPYPAGVKLGVMKQLANTQEITLSQMQILLGWAARRSQHTGRER